MDRRLALAAQPPPRPPSLSPRTLACSRGAPGLGSTAAALTSPLRHLSPSRALQVPVLPVPKTLPPQPLCPALPHSPLSGARTHPGGKVVTTWARVTGARLAPRPAQTTSRGSAPPRPGLAPPGIPRPPSLQPRRRAGQRFGGGGGRGGSEGGGGGGSGRCSPTLRRQTGGATEAGPQEGLEEKFGWSCFSLTAKSPARYWASLRGLRGQCLRRAGLGLSDTCVAGSLGGRPVTGHLLERNTSPNPSQGEIWGLSVLPRPRPPLHCPLQDGAFTSLPGTPKAGGESGRFSASGTHTFICNGFG
ncbi:uncharacterized protein LOC144340944 [Macaca mulatta]